MRDKPAGFGASAEREREILGSESGHGGGHDIKCKTTL